MAISVSADLKLFRSFSPHPLHNSRPLPPCSKIPFGKVSLRGSQTLRNDANAFYQPIKTQCLADKGDKLSCAAMDKDAEGFLVDSVDKSFSERLNLAWKTLFPSKEAGKSSNASIAKQRLKMILYSDRCEVSEEAKQKIVSSIVEALSDFVEIESQDKVQLNVSTDPGLGTVYSVIVPVRRVRPEYQESEEQYRGSITGMEYIDTGNTSGTVDVRFNFFVSDDDK